MHQVRARAHGDMHSNMWCSAFPNAAARAWCCAFPYAGSRGPCAYIKICVWVQDEGILAGQLGDGEGCQQAFRVLRSMVTAWVSDVQESSNVFADAMLMFLYRWLCSPDSELYDASLHRMVFGLMSKMLAKLIAEMTRLGAVVVYGGFERIIVATNKTTQEGAAEYVRYLVETIAVEPAYQFIVLKSQCMWHELLFMDETNYGGIVMSETFDSDLEGAVRAYRPPRRARRAPVAAARDDDADSLRLSDSDESDAPTRGRKRVRRGNDVAGVAAAAAAATAPEAAFALPDLAFDFHWNLTSVLPPSARHYFELAVGDFMVNPFNARLMHLVERTTGARAAAGGASQLGGPSQAAAAARLNSTGTQADVTADEAAELAFVRDYLMRGFGVRVLHFVTDLVVRVGATRAGGGAAFYAPHR